MALKVAATSEANHALVAPVRLLIGVGTHEDDHLGFVEKETPLIATTLMPSQLLTVDEPHATVKDLGHALVQGQRAQGLRF